VTITGLNLSAATAVAFGGTPAAIVSATATQIVTTVPAGAATGRITVTTPAGTATSRTSFTVT
jgi:IPT/TIG domain